MGRIANKHLAKLWDFMVFYNLNSGDHSVDILEAFLECDEALSELQDERDHWKTMYGNSCGDQDVLKESIRLLDTENRRLMAENKDLKKEYEAQRGLNVAIIKKHNEEMGQLLTENEDLKKRNEAQRHVIDDFVTKIDELIKDRDRKAEAVVELAKKRDELQEENDELKKKLTDENDIPKEEYEITFTMDKADYKDFMKLLLDAQSEKEKPDLTFGDIVKVPWSHSDYIFIETLASSVRLYNIPKKRFAVISKNEHLKRVGHIKK